MNVLKTKEVKKEDYIYFRGKKYYFEVGDGIWVGTTFVESKEAEGLMDFYIKHSQCFTRHGKSNFYVCYNINGKQFILKFSRLRLLKEILKEIRYLF